MTNRNFLLAIVLALVLSLTVIVACGDDDDDDDDGENDDDSTDDDTVNPDDDDDSGDDATIPQPESVVVPQGLFLMGCEEGSGLCLSSEKPAHGVILSRYRIAVYAITNTEFAQFLNVHGNDCDGFPCLIVTEDNHRLNEDEGVWTVGSGYENHPVFNVVWLGAKTFCEATGGRLPTEAEWEKGAKGTGVGNVFPWGGDWLDNAANCADSGDPFDNDTTPVGYYDGSDHDGTYQTTDGSSPYGVHDMVGNISEWVNDWYDPDYYTNDLVADPQGPESGDEKVFRGHSCGDPGGKWARLSARKGLSPQTYSYGYGFRCAYDPE